MKYLIIISICFSLSVGAFAAESNAIIDISKINKMLEIENGNKLEKEQELVNLYKERLNLLSYKERQLKMYENSLKSLKSEIELMQLDIEEKQSRLNEKEIVLLKKELALKEKQTDLNQLEEKLAQLDNLQLIRANTKPSMPSMSMKEIIIETNRQIKSEEKIRQPIVEKNKRNDRLNKNKSIKKSDNESMTKDKNNSVMSGLEEMKKDILNSTTNEK